MERTYYRIVQGPEVSVDDFTPAKQLGKPLREPEFKRQWSEGVSVYDTFERAVSRVRRFRYKLGRYVAAVTVPAEAGIEVEQSGPDPRHHTMYGSPERLMSFVKDPPVRVGKEQGR